ncbi:MAG: hypothetical protein J6Y77_04275 [Paludibacteraceae bacterium]|nr:hypothetical protein [Paludibacteraceae bacterium]
MKNPFILLSMLIASYAVSAHAAQKSIADTITVQELEMLISKDTIVDLGLSVYWSNINLGAKDICDNGDYFAWGETEPKTFFAKENSKTYGRNTYELKQDGIVNENGELTPTNDAASVQWGAKYRMPNVEEIEELFSSCEIKGYIVKTEEKGLVYGVMFESPKTKGKIFFPFPGVYKGDSIAKYDPDNDFRPNAGACWASSIHNRGAADIASNIAFTTGYYFYRHFGLPIRPVKEKNIDENADIWECLTVTSEMIQKKLGKNKIVDMGSGIKWTNCNLGAKYVYENGDYYAWGETSTKEQYTRSNSIVAAKDTADLANSGFVLRAKSTDDFGYEKTVYHLSPANDAAKQRLGKKYKTPDVDELESLLYTCNIKRLRVKTPEGLIIKGYLLKSKTNGNMLFFPMAGNVIETPNFNGIRALYWSSTMINNQGFYLDFSAEMLLTDPYIGLPIRAISK